MNTIDLIEELIKIRGRFNIVFNEEGLCISVYNKEDFLATVFDIPQKSQELFIIRLNNHLRALIDEIKKSDDPTNGTRQRLESELILVIEQGVSHVASI